MTNIEVLTGPQGGGKSRVMRDEAVEQPGRYLFALPTRELIDEQVTDFARKDSGLEVVAIYSEPNKGSTAKRLNEVRLDFEARNVEHGVVFTTHATLMDHPLHGFGGWHARIDEAPAAVQADRFTAMSLRSWLEETFELVGGDEHEWSAIQYKTANPDWQKVEQDTGAKKLSEFIKQAKQPARVFVKARSWDKRDIEWFSIWTPLLMSHFASVQIAGSSYTDSVGFKAAKSLFSDLLGVTLREIGDARTAQPSVTIHYFTRGHEGTTTFWSSHEGLRMLGPVEDYLVANLPASAFWSGNDIIETVMFGRMRAKFIQPLAMGLNKHRSATACAFIFSAKATLSDRPLMEVFKLTPEDIQHAREGDAIAQFAMRGAIRDPDYGGPYDIYLYSESQAERLKAHLHKIGFLNVELHGIEEVGIMDARRSTTAQQPLTAEEKEAKLQERRQRDNDRKKAKRDGKPPGRPAGSKDKKPRRSRIKAASD